MSEQGNGIVKESSQVENPNRRGKSPRDGQADESRTRKPRIAVFGRPPEEEGDVDSINARAGNPYQAVERYWHRTAIRSE